jgi:hypothetical protein
MTPLHLGFRKKLFAFIGFAFFLSPVFGQITINEDPLIARMMVVYSAKKGTNTTTPTGGGPVATPAPDAVIDGFRIQLLATTDRRKVEEVQSAFGVRYPNVYAGWSSAKPYYRVRVGAFTSRTDASSFLLRIKKEYPDAYIVPDKVKTSEMSN